MRIARKKVTPRGLLLAALFMTACGGGEEVASPTSSSSPQPSPTVPPSAPRRRDGCSFAPPLTVQGNRILDANGCVVQLEGFNTYDADKWMSVGKRVVDNWKNSWQVNVVRLTLRPEKWLGLPNQEQYLQATETFLDWCEQDGIYVVFDGYHESGSSGSVAFHWEAVKRAWHVLAPRFAERRHVLWDIYNEPYGTDGNNWTTWAPKAEELVDIIRGYNPVVKAALVPGITWAQEADVRSRPIAREQIIYSWHPYPHVYNSGSDANYWTYSYEKWDTHFGYITRDGIAPVFASEWHIKDEPNDIAYRNLLTKYFGDRNVSQTYFTYAPGWPNNLVTNADPEIRTAYGDWYLSYLRSGL